MPMMLCLDPRPAATSASRASVTTTCSDRDKRSARSSRREPPPRPRSRRDLQMPVETNHIRPCRVDQVLDVVRLSRSQASGRASSAGWPSGSPRRNQRPRRRWPPVCRSLGSTRWHPLGAQPVQVPGQRGAARGSSPPISLSEMGLTVDGVGHHRQGPAHPAAPGGRPVRPHCWPFRAGLLLRDRMAEDRPLQANR
jgi:hypothetical protein